MLFDSVLVCISLILLYYGGNFLVIGNLRLAKRFKVSPFIIGSTVVGFGTSAPEFAVSVMASLRDSGDLALANVIGSNITNIGLVLGLTTLMVSLTIEKKMFKDEAPSLLVTSFLIVGFAWDNYLSRLEGLIMISLLFIYLWKAFGTKKNLNVEIEEEQFFLENKSPVIQACLVISGMVMLILGANLMVEGATGIARKMGVSEWLIGVSIVALGTSLPEIVSSLIAAKRGHGEMAIGCVFGSNIFNILMVIGAASSIHPFSVGEEIHADLIYTTVVTCLLLILIRMDFRLRKWNGILLIICYGLYIGLKSAEIL